MSMIVNNHFLLYLIAASSILMLTRRRKKGEKNVYKFFVYSDNLTFRSSKSICHLMDDRYCPDVSGLQSTSGPKQYDGVKV